MKERNTTENQVKFGTSQYDSQTANGGLNHTANLLGIRLRK